MSTFTIDDIYAAQDRLKSVAVGVGPSGPINQMQGTFGGMRVIVGSEIVQQSTERLFPKSKHRSKRIRKKLLKRFGGEFRMIPASYRSGDTLYMHPAHHAQLMAATELQERNVLETTTLT